MKEMVDLHAHILPGLDDGARGLPDSLRMLEALEEIGFGHVFATPHQRLYSWKGLEPETVEKGVRDITAAARERGIGVNILPGMEFDLDETLPERAAAVPGGAGHLLVDVGFWGIPRDLAGLLERLTACGTRVLIVHPERNRELCRLRLGLSELIASGIRLLGNIGSFSGMYGDDVKRDALDLLKGGFYWAMASDMHSPDQSPWIRDGIKTLASAVGVPAVREMMVDRPMQIVKAMEGDL